jgi:hypothetical protein
MSLYENVAGSQALRSAARSFAINHGVKNSAKLEQQVDEKISALAKGMDLSPAELRQLAIIVLRTQERVATGAHTQADTDEWSRGAFADLKSRHVSNKRVTEVIHATNAWLKAKHPAIHEVLKHTPPLGSHEFIVRHLTDRYLQHERETERTARASKWPTKARADQMAATVGRGGLLAPPAASVGSTALQSLARNPLGTDPNAAAA